MTATFFSTGTAVERFPQAIERLVRARHEVGSHGFTHQRLDRMSALDVRDEVQRSVALLRNFDDVVSFRAPYLSFPERYLPLLAEQGLRLDSSTARYKSLGSPSCVQKGGMTRVPVSMLSSALRLPAFARNIWVRRLRAPAVLLVHPWELVDLRRAPIRWDCRFRTGVKALQYLAEAVDVLLQRGFHFAPLRDLVRERESAPKSRVATVA